MPRRARGDVWRRARARVERQERTTSTTHPSWVKLSRRRSRSPGSRIVAPPAFPDLRSSGVRGVHSPVTVARTASDSHRLPVHYDVRMCTSTCARCQAGLRALQRRAPRLCVAQRRSHPPRLPVGARCTRVRVACCCAVMTRAFGVEANRAVARSARRRSMKARGLVRVTSDGIGDVAQGSLSREHRQPVHVRRVACGAGSPGDDTGWAPIASTSEPGRVDAAGFSRDRACSRRASPRASMVAVIRMAAACRSEGVAVPPRSCREPCRAHGARRLR
jgi:hypothetical protein